MATKACAICGEPTDADLIDGHGHFSEPEDLSAQNVFDGDPAEAEADLRRAADAISAAEDQLEAAKERAEAIEMEPFDGSPEAEADISRRMEVVEREIEYLEQVVADAWSDLGRTQDHWEAEGYLT